ncbi:hypothetical protein KKC97_14270 [bacterium]|nr:hypothetical protein [bacterium]MBU1638824.1 hypothetical protein [bacterium]
MKKIITAIVLATFVFGLSGVSFASLSFDSDPVYVNPEGIGDFTPVVPPQPKKKLSDFTPVVPPQPKKKLSDFTPVVPPQPKKKLSDFTPVVPPQPKKK